MKAEGGKLLSPFSRAAIVVALLLFIWLALRNAAIALFAQVQPSFALAFPPTSGRALAIHVVRFPPPTPTDQVQASAEALGRDPLSAWPFVAAADAAQRAGNPPQAIALLEEAVRRNSRQADMRGRLFQLYFAEGRWSEGVDEAIAFAGLRSAMSDNVAEALLLLLNDVRGRAILARHLQERPEWRARLQRLASGRPAERQLDGALRAVEAAQAGSPAGSEAPLSADRYLAWVMTLPRRALPYVLGVYDGDFRGLPGAPPFNWEHARDPDGQVSIQPGAERDGTGLHVRTSASRSGVLARQMLALSAGPHAFGVEASGRGTGRLTWNISCVDGRRLVEIPVPMEGRPELATRPFDVPSGCSFQTLVLDGSAAAGRTAEAQTARVSVRPGA